MQCSLSSRWTAKAGHGRFRIRSTPIHLSSIADPHDKNAEFAILDIGDDPIITDAILPKITEFCPLQRFPDAAWIVQSGDAIGEKAQDAYGIGATSPSEFLFRGGIEPNPPGHRTS